MALLTLHRTPSVSTAPDESIPRRGNLQKRESFAWVKGVVLLLEEGEREGSNEGLSPDRSPSPKPEGGPPPDTRHRHLQAMVSLLRPEDTVKLAVQLESSSPVRVRYLIVISTCSNKHESVLLGMDFPKADSDECTIGLVLPVWSDTQVYLDGDGGFSVTTAEETRIFKPVSIQTMWSVLQALHGCCERAVKGAVIPGCGLDWAAHYQRYVESDRYCLNEWEAMNDLQSMRKESEGQGFSQRSSIEAQIKDHLRDIMRTEDLDNLTSKMVRTGLETRMNMDMMAYREYIDNEMMVTFAQMDKPSRIFDYLYLGSEWNAANFEELQKNNVGYILNVTREIDNFFPEAFTYMNIRVYDVEATDLLPHWTDTYQFINTARKSGQAVLVHCKMGVSRSASTVIAYAMKQQRWPVDEAQAYVRECRPITRPNDGFARQLQTYNGILNASQQRHSALWRRKSRDQRNLSLHKEDEPEAERDSQGDEGEEDFEEEDTDEDEEEEEEEEIPDIVGIDKVFEDQPATNQEPSLMEAPAPAAATPNPNPNPNPTITVQDSDKTVLNRSGRMNLFSLMQSISELDDDKLPSSPRRSPMQRRRSQARKGLTHQRACVDVSPEPRSQSEKRIQDADGKSM
ncbi:protein phosphatase Slingshot homolog 3 [Gadus morhua]|uniref:protein phosphatase Slingshot homolog 3 n=1 Tax=Gadus morhua TaxID=8049 RepID=UPI0011B4CD6A|nr:protein phosphatase Slingshot homolog 3-like [Gadus morhua]